MSVRVMSAVWKSSLPTVPKMILLALADCAHDDGTKAFPSVPSLARKTGMTERAVQNNLRALEANGQIAASGDTFRGSRVYSIILSALSQDSPGGEPDSPGGVNDVHRGGEPDSPPSEPSYEPSVENQLIRPASRNGSTGFEEFWKAYPSNRRKEKPKALKAWLALHTTDQLRAEIMAGLERQKASPDWQKDGGQFVVYPERFLKYRRWEDGVDSSPVYSPPSDGIPFLGRGTP